MITAHLPAGYVLARSQRWSGLVLWAAMAGAIFPDFDLLFFYFVDDRAIHHHRYWVHAPAFAFASSALFYIAARLFAPHLRPAALAFGAAWLLHICLDSLTGGIMWLWPFSGDLFRLIEVPGREGVPWLVAFLTHWTMVFELLIWAAAIWFLWRARAER